MRKTLSVLMILVSWGALNTKVWSGDSRLAEQTVSVSVPIYGSTHHKPNSIQQIPLVQMNKQGYFIPVLINGIAQGTFMIDTAASHSVLSHEMARRAGITPHSQSSSTVITVMGKTKLPMFLSKSLTIGPYQMHNIRLILQDLDKSLEIDGLLGLDVLYRFDFSLSRQHLILNLQE